MNKHWNPLYLKSVCPRLFLLLALIALNLPFALCAKGFDKNVLRQMDTEINQGIAENRCPGAVIWVEHNHEVYEKAFGNRALVPEKEAMTKDTIFDLASLTKVIAGTPAIMILVERGFVNLDDPVQKYIPEFTGGGKENVTIKQLLTHTSGQLPDIETKTDWHGTDVAVQKAVAEKLRAQPGTVFRYSDVNLFMIGAIVERVSGMKLQDFVQLELYKPLKMNDTGFLPPTRKLKRIAPTEYDPANTNHILRGVVHDPTARHMGGVAGHAGLFSTAADLARFARMMLNEGTLDGVRVFKPETVELMTSVQTPPGMEDRRGLGWDIDSGFSRPRGKIFPRGSYGHTGWTGTCLWIDPNSKSFFIFLSNRVHPDGKSNVLPLYSMMGTLTAQAITDYDFKNVPHRLPAFKSSADDSESKKVLNGIDVLERDNFAPLKGLKIGLISNNTGRDRFRKSTIELMTKTPGVEVKALFSPEHGLYGLKDEKVDDAVDPETHLPVYSLFGKNHAPTLEQMSGLDALVYDIQDVGCRFYTYTSTLGLSLEAAGKAKIKFFVLDRVNPINGNAIDGPVLAGPTSFVAFHPVPVRYAMTLGELAQMFNDERHFQADLTVIKAENWKREYFYDETGLPWQYFSPNMRTETEAILYPGVGLLERTAISVGRGTGTPWEVVGAPYIDDVKLSWALNQAKLPGVKFLPVRFTPQDSVFKGQECGGVNIVLTDRDRCNVVDIGLTLGEIINRWYPEQFKVEKMDVLMGSPATLQAVKQNKSLQEIHDLWAPDLKAFKERRARYLLY